MCFDVLRIAFLEDVLCVRLCFAVVNFIRVFVVPFFIALPAFWLVLSLRYCAGWFWILIFLGLV